MDHVSLALRRYDPRVSDTRREQRVLGIVGGTGPESTVDYYRSLVATWRRRRPEPSNAGVPVLNTAQIHVDAAVEWLRGPT